ncbi:MAG: ester cyclase [Gemmatimonadota bacterium]|jgi:steroid delta-isomerase-like uncharacterized protein
MKGLVVVLLALVFAGLAAWYFYAASGSPPPAGIISMERAEEVGAIYEEARNTPDLDLLDRIYSADALIHDCSLPEDIVGLDALKAYYQGNHDGFPDLSMQVHDMFLAQEKIAFLWTFSGTHTGDMRGMPATGRSVSFSGVAIDRIVDGQIVEEWVYFNVLDLMQQLGMQLVPVEGG